MSGFPKNFSKYFYPFVCNWEFYTNFAIVS